MCHEVVGTVPKSLRRKLLRTMVGLLAVICSVTLVVVAALNFLTSRATLATMEARLRENISRQGGQLVGVQALALRDLVADNAFGDVARLVERTTQQNDDLVYGLFLDSELTPWAYSWRDIDPKSAPKWDQLGIDTTRLDRPGVSSTSKTINGQMVFEFATPVVDDKGVFLGSLRYGVSDRALKAALAGTQAASRRALATELALLLTLGVLTIAIGVVLSRRAAARITSPVTALTEAANAFGAGRRDVRVDITSQDELQVLGAAFNKMVSELQVHTDRLQEMNRDLENKVAARTGQLAGRNRDMRLVLDNVEQGLITLSAAGQMADERSRMVAHWFGECPPSARFTDYIGASDPAFAEMFQLGFDALLEGTLPRELCLDQLPRRIRTGGREFACTYRPLGEGEALDGLLIVIDDVTSELSQAKREAERAEVMALFEALMKDRTGFLAFVAESSRQLAEIREGDLIGQKRLIHTLKGNCHVMGLSVMGELCEAIESQMAESQGPPSAAVLATLEQRWSELMQTLQRFLGERDQDVVEVDRAELERLDDEVRRGVPSPRIRERLASWKLEPAERALGRLASQARALTRRFGKGEVSVVADGGGVRLSPEAWGGFWSVMVHVVRNAVDHGFELPAERARLGKPAQPHLRLAVSASDRSLFVDVEDDGAGIDWDCVRQKAVAYGLPHETEDDLMRAIFAPSFTTRGEATAISGRGIGLAAVLDEVERRGGSVVVRSRPGAGTSFRFSLPVRDPGARASVGMTDAKIPMPASA